MRPRPTTRTRHPSTPVSADIVRRDGRDTAGWSLPSVRPHAHRTDRGPIAPAGDRRNTMAVVSRPVPSRGWRPVPGRCWVVVVLASAIGLAACTGSASDASPAASAALAPQSVAALPPATSQAATTDTGPSPTPSGQALPSAAAVAGATAVPTSIDPSQVITAQEAGKLTGATFGPGKESTTQGNARICTYGAGTKSVFTVEVAIAPDLATAKADEAAAKADLQSQAKEISATGLTVTQLPNFAPGADAALAEGSMTTPLGQVGARGIYVLHGTTFFALSDVAVGAPPPSADAMKSEAMTVLGRLP